MRLKKKKKQKQIYWSLNYITNQTKKKVSFYVSLFYRGLQIKNLFYGKHKLQIRMIIDQKK